MITTLSIKSSPFDVLGVKTKASTDDILDAIRDSRSRNI
jgi:curved DNA-binding protein CbpA